ncbi:MAG: winged helix-turn-helix transcriptional regulator [Anaerolineae bacterium]|nr:winged helix-turn-helix transcriptional regulator [Anaerolineae bacterium]
MIIDSELTPSCIDTLTEENNPGSSDIQIPDLNTVQHLANTFKALSDPTRVCIIAALMQHELCVHELAATLEMTQSAISHQLHTLREMRIVRFTKEGRHVYYALDDEHIRDIFRQMLAHVEHT